MAFFQEIRKPSITGISMKFYLSKISLKSLTGQWVNWLKQTSESPHVYRSGPSTILIFFGDQRWCFGLQSQYKRVCKTTTYCLNITKNSLFSIWSIELRLIVLFYSLLAKLLQFLNCKFLQYCIVCWMVLYHLRYQNCWWFLLKRILMVQCKAGLLHC